MAIAIVNPVVAGLTAPVVAAPGNRRISDDVDPLNNDRQATISLEANWRLDAATITAISAYQNYRNEQSNPIDRIDNPLPTFVGTGAPYAKFDDNSGTINLRQYSQELRIASSGTRRLNYVAGIYYAHVDIDRFFFRRRSLCATGTVIGAMCAAPINQSSQLFAINRADSIAGFAQLDYRLVGGLKAIGGLRLQRETTSVDGRRIAPALAGDGAIPGNAPSAGRKSARDTALTGKVGLQYAFDRDAQAYVSYTRGYKGKGFNTELATDFANQQPVEPEYVDAYEIGFKGRTRDGLLSANLAVFRADYTNLQIQANRSNAATGVIAFVQTNAGTSRTRGVELEVTLQPARWFSLTGGATYAKATVNVDGLNCPLQVQSSAPIVAGSAPINSCYRAQTTGSGGALVTSGPIQNVRGGALPYSPKLRLMVTPRVEHPLPGSDLIGFAQTAIAYQSKQQFAIEQDPLAVQRAYTLVDLTIGVHAADDRWGASLFVRNLFDRNYFSSIGHNSLLATVANPYDLNGYVNKDADRYIGGTISFRFR